MAQFDPKHEIGIWLPLALADIYTTLLASVRVKNVPSALQVLRSWQLGTLADMFNTPAKPHKQGGIYGGDLARMFAKELK